MSAIGDYIHLTTKGYKTYGIDRQNDNGKSLNREQALTQQRKLMQARLANLKRSKEFDEALKELENRVQKLGEKQDSIKFQMDGNLQNQGQQLVDRQLTDLLLNQNKNFNKQIQSNKKYNINDALGNKSEFDIDKLIDLRKKIYNSIEVFNKREGALNTNNIKALSENIETFFKECNFCIEQLRKQFPFLSQLNLEYISNPSKYNKTKGALKILKAILEAITLTTLSSSLNGPYGEIIVSMAGDVAFLRGKKALDDAVKQHLANLSQGEQRSVFKIEKQQVSELYSKDEKDGFIFQAHATQDKVDMTISIKNQVLNTSVKAYTPKGNAITTHLQDVTLLYNLLGCNIDFANHWINQIIHIRGGRKTDAQAYNEELYKSIAYEALVSGNLLKQNNTNAPLDADAFVVINPVTNEVYAKSTFSILNEAINSQMLQSNFKFSPSLSQISLYAARERIRGIYGKGDPKAQESARITYIIQDLHKTKIGVSYRTQLEKVQSFKT